MTGIYGRRRQSEQPNAIRKAIPDFSISNNNKIVKLQFIDVTTIRLQLCYISVALDKKIWPTIPRVTADMSRRKKMVRDNSCAKRPTGAGEILPRAYYRRCNNISAGVRISLTRMTETSRDKSSSCCTILNPARTTAYTAHCVQFAFTTVVIIRILTSCTPYSGFNHSRNLQYPGPRRRSRRIH